MVLRSGKHSDVHLRCSIRGFPHRPGEGHGCRRRSGCCIGVRSFPFNEQLEKAKTLSEPTFPTISFRSGADDAVLAVWSLEPDEFEIYLEQNEQKVTLAVRGEAPPIDAIQSFFNGSRAELYKRLAKQAGAVTRRGFWIRLKSLFGGK